MKKQNTFLFLFVGLLIFNSSVKAQKKKFQLWKTKTEDSWEDFRKVSYLYNTDGNLIEEKTERVMGDTLINQFRFLTEYNENGKIRQKTREIWEDNSWTFAIQSSYIYKNSQVTQRKDSMLLRNKISVSLIIYNYNHKGQLIHETGKASKLNLGVVPRVNYQYNKNGQPVVKEFPVFKNGAWAKSRKMTLKYNDKGHHIETIRYTWKNDQWIESTHYQMKVDKHGNRLSELWSRPSEKGRRAIMRISYIYEN